MPNATSGTNKSTQNNTPTDTHKHVQRMHTSTDQRKHASSHTHIYTQIPQQPTFTKADSTLRSSQAVPHPSTNRALRRLTSEVRRDPVHSTRYGRQQVSRPMRHQRTTTHTHARRDTDTHQTLSVALCVAADQSFRHRSHFGSRYKLGCCGHAGLFGLGSIPFSCELTTSPACTHAQVIHRRAYVGLCYIISVHRRRAVS